MDSKGRQYIDKIIEELGSKYNIAYIGLYGSQNYGLATENSDYDFIAIVIPTLDDLIANKSYSTTHNFDFGQVVIKDLRFMVDQWKKGSVNFFEILFTNIFYINPKFPTMQWYRDHAEQIAHMNEIATCIAMLGMMHERIKNVDNPTETQCADIEKYGYSAKALSNIIRLCSMIEHYRYYHMEELLNPFTVLYKANNPIQFSRNIAIRIKKHMDVLSKEEVIGLAQSKMSIAETKFNSYKDKLKPFNSTLYEDMKQIANGIIRWSVEQEITQP